MTELEIYLRARYPLLYLLTPEEERAIATLRALAETLRKEVVCWSFTEGLAGDPATRDPIAALDAIQKADTRTLYVMRDLHAFFGNPGVVRKLREVGQAVKQSAKGVVLVSPVFQLPPELTKDVTLVDFELPDGETITQMIQGAGVMAKCPVALDLLQQERLVAAAKGLTAGEIANALAKSLVMHRALDERTIGVMIGEKQQIIKKTGVLEYYDHSEAIERVGGVALLKDWLRKRNAAFTQKARDFGVPEPRGLMLVGVQGCGKSLAAKAVASTWGLPLLRLDVGRLMSGLVGGSEENVRRALAMAEALSPVVLWVDEIEKGFAGLGSSGDGGTSNRVLATFLTWLQEKSAPVFVVATANHIDLLPPELLRKGRFDEIFFVDLPSTAERKAILEIHLKKRRRLLADFDLDRLAANCEGFTGAEIEQALIAALYDAFDAGRAVTDADLTASFLAMVPLSKTMAEPMERLRAWARDKTRPASAPMETSMATPAALPVDLPVG